MKINRITIKNFRGIKYLDNLEVSSLNSFVGKNDSGKSIILRAIESFYREKIDTKDVFKGIGPDEVISIQISYQTPIEIDDLLLDSLGNLTIKKEFYFDSKGACKVNKFFLSKDYINEEYQNLWSLKEEELNSIIEKFGLEVKKSGRGNKNIIRIETIKDFLISSDRIDKYNDYDEVQKKVEKIYNLKEPEFSFFDAEQNLDIGATTFQNQFKTIISECFDNNKEITDDLEVKLNLELNKEFELIKSFMSKNVSNLKEIKPLVDCDWKKSVKFDLNMKFEDEEYDIPISHKGTGFKRLLMVAYFEYLASKKNISNQIFAIEEPETFLHPSAQNDLLNSIIQLSLNSQFFITTHSPVFAGATRSNSSVLVKKNSNGKSEYFKGEKIIPLIIDELGIKPDYNLLSNVKYLIFVEGKDDVLFLTQIAEILLNKKLHEDRIELNIGGGSALKNSADLDLFKRLTSNNKYAVFVDGDNNDLVKQKEKEIIKLKCESDNAFFYKLSKREIENYCHPEAIKRTLINEIIQMEGPESQNPRIEEIRNLEITINDEMDVDKYLSGIGIMKFKSNEINLKVFKEMKKEEWLEIDTNNDLINFINDVYLRCDT